MPSRPNPTKPLSFSLTGRSFVARAQRRDLATLGTITLFLLTLIWVLAWERLRFEEAQSIAEAKRQSANLAFALEEQATSTLRGTDQAVRLVKHGYQDHPASLDIPKLINNGTIDHSLLLTLFVCNEAGDVVPGSLDYQPTNLAFREYFQFHRQNNTDELYIGRPVFGRLSGKWSFHLSRRISKPDGSFGGVVAASISPEYFTQLYQQTDLGTGGAVALLGRDGVVRALRTGNRSSFGEDYRDSALFREIASQTNGDLFDPGRLDGIPRYFSYRALSHYPLLVAVGISRDQALAESIAHRRNIWITAQLVSTVILLGGAWLAMTQIQRRRAEGAHRATEARYQATFDQAAEGVANITPDYHLLQVNRRFCEMLGYHADELANRHFFDIIHPADHGATEVLLQALQKGRKALPEIECRYLHKDGTLLWMSVGISLVSDLDGSPAYFVAIGQNITCRKEAEERYHATFNQAAVAIAHTTPDGNILCANDKLCELTGYSNAELCGMNVRQLVHRDDWGVVFDDRKALIAGHVSDSLREQRLLRPDGAVTWVSRGLSLVRQPSGEPRYFISLLQDITERKRVELALLSSQEQFEQLATHIPEAFWINDVVGRVMLYVSPALARILGRPQISPITAFRDWLDAIHPGDRERARAAHRNCGTTGHLEAEYRISRPDGSVRWVHVRGFPVRNAAGCLIRIVGTVEDLTEHKALQERLQELAHFDSLTHLPNRALCYDRLKQALALAGRRSWQVGVLLIDLDRFKVVNDTLGHNVGDQLLRDVAERLNHCARASDTVGRLGGDEFTVIVTELATPGDAALVAQKVLDALAAPFQVEGHEAFVTASIGIATFPNDGHDADTLIKNADTAMYRAKESGRNNYQFYTAAMNEQALQKLLLENELRRAVERSDFVLHYQAKAHAVSGAIIGCEALIRWPVPGAGLVSPGQFVPLLEESGLIVPVGDWVIRAACEQIRHWQRAGIEPVPIAVNLAAGQFRHHDICAVVTAALAEHHVDPELLELEITESEAMQNAEATLQMLDRIRELGVAIAIDDFGTGYSSLSYLKRFPVNSLKLDRSFVKDLPDDAEDAAITQAVITMAHGLGLTVVAEGVESAEQQRFLAASGCDYLQGYHLARPLAAEDFTTLLIASREAQSVARKAARLARLQQTAVPATPSLS